MKLEILSAIAVSAMISSAAYAAAADEAAVRVNFNGSELTGRGYIVNDRTLVPVRNVFNEMGFAVRWREEERTAYLWNSDYRIVLPADSESFTVNGESITPDVPQTIIDDSLYLPLRAISEVTGANVTWNDYSRTASIEKEPELPQTADGTVTAVIDEVCAGEKNILYLYKVYDDDVYKLDLTDKAYIISLYGETLPFYELHEDDVVSVAYDTDAGFDESEYYTIYVSRDTVEGEVVEVDNSGEIPVYKIDNGLNIPSLWGKEYDIKLGSYTYFLDIFGRAVEVESLGGFPFDVHYGVLQSLLYEDGQYYVEITDENGNKKQALRDGSAARKAHAILYLDEPEIQKGYNTYLIESDLTERTDGNISELKYRVIQYAENKQGKIAFLRNMIYDNRVYQYEGEYDKSEHKLGAMPIYIGYDHFIDLRSFEEDGTYRIIDDSQLTDHETYTYGFFRSGSVVLF